MEKVVLLCLIVGMIGLLAEMNRRRSERRR
jgi:hypothetical protein